MFGYKFYIYVYSMNKILQRGISLFLFLVISCTPPIDYYGNSVNLEKEIIYLTKMREDPKIKDRYYLTFKEIYGATESDVIKKNKTLERYFSLIMGYYGYTEKKIIDQKDKNVLKPLYYVTVQFN
mgnify:FL=1